MTHGEAIAQLAVAIGYALDSTNEQRDQEYRKKSKLHAVEILEKVIDSRPFDYDPIIIKGSDFDSLKVNP